MQVTLTLPWLIAIVSVIGALVGATAYLTRQLVKVEQMWKVLGLSERRLKAVQAQIVESPSRLEPMPPGVSQSYSYRLPSDPDGDGAPAEASEVERASRPLRTPTPMRAPSRSRLPPLPPRGVDPRVEPEDDESG